MSRNSVTGSKQLSAKLKAMGGDVSRHLEKAAVAGALVIQNKGKEKAPVKSGTLRRSIHIGGHEDQAPDFKAGDSNASVPLPEVSDDAVTVYIGTNLVYAAIQEYGGTITPKQARALFFEIDGEAVVAKSVTIPARPYMRPAFDEGHAEALADTAAALADIIRAAAT